ncbi:MAG: NADP-specific glutamate dehydrogenase [Bacilli bacterium]|nr:NADP-specific glutamate dehydrogenase [Bacilli bacterium]
MFQNAYLERVYSDVLKNHPHQVEFHQTVLEVFQSIEKIIPTLPHFEDQGILERLVEPERVILFRVPWVDDAGRVQVNRGYRVQFNSAIGPYKGGLRFDSSVNLSIMKFLAFEQTFKNALTGLPMGGGKGGSDFSSAGKSEGEIMRFCQSFMSELYRHIGPDTDVPAGDLGVGAREIGYLYGYYRKLTNEFTGTFTGKRISFGGSLARTEATGFGICYFAEAMLKRQGGTSLKGKRVLVSGTGNVGTYAIQKAIELGAHVVGINDINHTIHDEEGIDIKTVLSIRSNRQDLGDYGLKHPQATITSNPKDLWKIKCDVAIPCATQNELGIDDAKILVSNGLMALIEGANMPTTLEATHYFQEKGILFSPGKASNAGGVATSGLEMSQNSIRESWTFEAVDQKLQTIMLKIYDACYEASVKVGEPGNLVVGANIAGFLKVYDAMLHQGII